MIEDFQAKTQIVIQHHFSFYFLIKKNYIGKVEEFKLNVFLNFEVNRIVETYKMNIKK